MTEMTHWERIQSTMQGEATDRSPICLWRHWPIKDQEPESLADAIVSWQQKYDCDLVKHAPAGSYVVKDWGGQTTYIPENNRGLGVYTFTRRGITATDQWPDLPQLDVTQGHLGQQIAAIRMVAERLNNSVPIMQTIFSPLNIAPKLAGELAFEDMRHSPDIFERGLKIIAETTTRFAQACLDAGAHGVLFVAQCNYDMYSEDEYRQFGEPYDRLILETIQPQAQITVLLAQGHKIMFDRICDYPIDALNWHDQTRGPSLKEAYDRFPGLLMGGINEEQTLLNGSPEAIQSEIRDAITQVGGRRLLVGTGGAPLIATPPEHFHAARKAVEV
jgi:uroporphyrinogen decarboxylase